MENRDPSSTASEEQPKPTGEVQEFTLDNTHCKKSECSSFKVILRNNNSATCVGLKNVDLLGRYDADFSKTRFQKLMGELNEQGLKTLSAGAINPEEGSLNLVYGAKDRVSQSYDLSSADGQKIKKTILAYVDNIKWDINPRSGKRSCTGKGKSVRNVSSH
jgi:hypothetical protein